LRVVVHAHTALCWLAGLLHALYKLTFYILIVQNLPPCLGLLEATLAALPSWTHVLSGFPVVRWPTFAEYIRSCVNILATEHHLHELICQLQLMGQVSARNLGTVAIIVITRCITAVG